jgi:hypothetical protein
LDASISSPPLLERVNSSFLKSLPGDFFGAANETCKSSLERTASWLFVSRGTPGDFLDGMA